MRYALALMLFAACATTQANQPPNGPGAQKTSAEDPNSGTVECHDETPTGSLISHQVCREKKGAHDEVNSPGVQQTMEGPQKGPPTRGN